MHLILIFITKTINFMIKHQAGYVHVTSKFTSFVLISAEVVVVYMVLEMNGLGKCGIVNF